MRERSGRIPFAWHLARWRETEPGWRGLAWLALLSLLIAVPLERFGADVTWTTQARTLINLGVTLAAILIGRETAAADEIERWLVLQGYSPAEWALSRWVANLLPLATLALLWTLLVATSATLQGSAIQVSGLVGLALHILLMGLLFTALLLLIGAAGVKQTSEVLLLVLILTLLLPLVGNRVPEAVTAGLRLLLPPLGTLAAFRDGVVELAWRPALEAALRLATWGVVTLGLALTLIGRRCPERPPRGTAAAA